MTPAESVDVIASEKKSLQKIFNHDILSCTNEGVSGNHLYSGRALGLTEPTDIIQIHPFLKREWDEITAHYHRIKLRFSTNVIWDVSLERLDEYPGVDESVFFFGPNENKVRFDHKRFRVVEYINNKNNFTALASQLRLDIVPTQCFHGKQWFAGIEYFDFPCYVKAAVSVAGKGIFRCETPEEVIKALSYFDEDVPLQVQNEIKTDVFLNMQYEATDTELKRFLVSEQILDGFTHQGNQYPAQEEPWESVQPMAEWLWKKGMRGIFAFDVGIVKEEGKETRYIPIECNPRFNGASYPSGIATRLDMTNWVAKEIETQFRTLKEIDLTGIEYNPVTRTGIIIVNWGTILAGKIGVLISGLKFEQEELEAELRARL